MECLLYSMALSMILALGLIEVCHLVAKAAGDLCLAFDALLNVILRCFLL
jgi:hypothetical protein